MCGIAGFFNYDSGSRERTLEAMGEALAHRGPDGDGVFLDGPLGLAHRRLAIIDIGPGGHQPMFSVDRRFVTVFNGEIYNYRELREILSSKGCEFRTDSDTEVVAEAIRVWGIEKAVCEFRGMFAFAVYNFHEKRLFLGRDRTGIKPLYFAEKNGALFFASEQKALLEVPEIEGKANPIALHDFLTFGFPVTPDTCWSEIKMFPPANFAEIKPGVTLVPHRYWRWECRPEKITRDEALERAEDVLKDSLKFHLRSDVPLASFLSGGIDSSLLVMLMMKGNLVDSLSTFNVGFGETRYDESEDARHVADAAGTDHHEIRMDIGQGTPEEFERILLQYDEPYGDSSCLPTFRIASEVRSHVKVVISGDGGDELFGGYDRFINAGRISSLRRLPMKKLIKQLLNGSSSIVDGELARKLNNALTMAQSGSAPELFALLHTYFTEQDKSALYTPEFAAMALSKGESWKRFGLFVPENGGKNTAIQLMETEAALNLHADYLRKVDIASSAHGLEVRVPFLDSEVMEFAASLPLDLKVHEGKLKYLLRELARKNISDKIADKEKWGFGIPFDRWCGDSMKDYLYDLLFSDSADSGIWNIFRKRQGEILWEKFISPDTASYRNISRYQIYQRIFMLSSTQLWMKKFSPSFDYTLHSETKRPNLSMEPVFSDSGRPHSKIMCVIGQLGNGGTERQLYLFLKHLNPAFYKASVIVAGEEGGIWESRIKALGTDIVFLGKANPLRKLKHFRKYVKKMRPDAIFSWSFFTNAFCTVSGKTPFIGSLRQQYSETERAFSETRRKLCLLPEKIIINSSFIRDELVQAGVNHGKLEVVFNIFESVWPDGCDVQKERAGIRADFMNEQGISGKIIVAGVGRDSPTKDMPFFIDVIRHLPSGVRDKFHVLLIGSGGLKMKPVIQDAGLEEQFTLTGDIPDARKLLPAADIFFLSSREEGMPNVLLEAIDAGCAPLATDVGGVRDIFSGLPAGLLEKALVTERNPEKAAEMLAAQIESETLRKEISKHTGEFIHKQTPENIMSRFLRILFP